MTTSVVQSSTDAIKRALEGMWKVISDEGKDQYTPADVVSLISDVCCEAKLGFDALPAEIGHLLDQARQRQREAEARNEHDLRQRLVSVNFRSHDLIRALIDGLGAVA
ncbi:MAG TPA: hypothetical protein VFK03_00055 [Candidatus Saccharimonadales bacterium]|nr:hypothetical protein [Candidatus Saccharimonadales bacterium]